jgi:N-acetylglutamate synthase-like GNAT family acetyltransferase
MTIYDDLHIRVATVDDLGEIMQLASDVAKENALFDTSAEHLVKIVWPCLTLKSGIIGVIGKRGGPIEGMVVLVVGTLAYSDAPCVEEKCVFVRKEFRSAKGGRAHKLLQFSKSVADKLSLPLLIGVLSNTDTRNKVKMYEREFGEPAGCFWVWKARTGSAKVA